MVVGLALCVIGLWMLLKPAEYQAAVKIIIGPSPAHEIDSNGVVDVPYVPYDPYFFEAELKVMVSEVVLSNVVDTLHLNTEWGKRYGRTLGTAEAIKLLSQHIDIGNLQNTRIVEIRVTDEDPNEAARIANAIAEAYKNYRIEQQNQQRAAGIKILEEDYQKEEARIKAMQTHLEELRKNLNLTNKESDIALKARYPEYYRTKQNLDSENITAELLKAKIEFDKKDDSIPRAIPIEVIDPAVPPKSPCGPARRLGADLLVCGLAVAGFGFYSIRSGRTGKMSA